MHTIAIDVTSSTKEARISHNCDPCSYFAVFITSPIAYTYNKNEKQHERSFCRHLHSRESWKKGGGNQCHVFSPSPPHIHTPHTHNHYYSTYLPWVFSLSSYVQSPKERFILEQRTLFPRGFGIRTHHPAITRKLRMHIYLYALPCFSMY